MPAVVWQVAAAGMPWRIPSLGVGCSGCEEKQAAIRRNPVGKRPPPPAAGEHLDGAVLFHFSRPLSDLGAVQDRSAEDAENAEEGLENDRQRARDIV
jgi:hypothetical protein